MTRFGTVALHVLVIFVLNACNNSDKGDDDTGDTYTIEDLYGTWSTELMYWGGNEFNGVNITFSESNFLLEIDTVRRREDGVEGLLDIVACFAPNLVMNPDGTISAPNMIPLGYHDNFGMWVFDFTSHDILTVQTGWVNAEEQAAGLPSDEATLTRASDTRAIDPADCEEQ